MILDNWNIIKRLCHHKANIYSYKNIINENTKESKQIEEIKYSEIQCYFVNNSSELNQNAGSNDLNIKGLLILPPYLKIDNGDKIVVFQNSNIPCQTFKAHNIWGFLDSHIEVSLILKDEV